MSHLATDDWQQAMISGNGRQGVLCYGRPGLLRLTLSHERLFLPVDEPLEPPDTGAVLPHLRALCFAGRFAEAADTVVATAVAGDPRYEHLRQADPFIGAATLTVTLDGRSGEPRAWRREVDFATGVVRLAWTDDAGPVTLETFVSRPHDVVVVRLSGRTLSGRLTLGPIDGVPPVPIAFSRPVGLGLTARFPAAWPGGVTGYRVAVRTAVHGGRSVAGPDGTLVLHSVDAVTLTARTTVDPAPAGLPVDDVPMDFDALLRPHTAVHGALFDRCRLRLGPPDGRPTEDLLAAGASAALVQKLFDAGRYAVISASGEHPPNLQGVWSGTYEPAWRGGYTLDGNLAAALAALAPTGTPELLLPLFDLLDTYRDDFRRNARRLYGLPGLVLPPHLTTHGRHNHFSARWCLTFWTGGAAWMARLYIEYWRYTGDEVFLRTRALPFLREAAEFYAAFLTEPSLPGPSLPGPSLPGHGGGLCLAPSYSPENAPDTAEDSQASVNATMEVAAVRGLLRDLVELDDPASTGRWQALIDRLPPYRVDRDGSLAEWLWPELPNNHAHRHSSHLYGLWYDPDHELLDDPTLRGAAETAVRLRLAWWRRTGDEMAFGLTQLGQAAAALGLADEAYEALAHLAERYWRPSLVPTHNVSEIFNIDVCGSLPALIVAMLVRSRSDRVELLPACPAGWADGEIRGVLLRDGVSVRCLTWSRTGATVELLSARPREVVVAAPAGPDSPQTVMLEPGRVAKVAFTWDAR